MSKVKFKYGTAEQLANAPYLEGTFYVISDDNSTDGILYADLHGNRICFGDVASLVKKVSKLESSAQDTKIEVDWLRSNIIKNIIEKDTTITADDVHTVPPQEVVIYGKSEQNGTPTPVTPISIDSLDNKFTLHVAKNGITDYGDWPIMFDLGSYILRSLPDGTCDILRMSYSKPSEDAGWAMYDTTLEQTIANIALADLEWTQLSNGIFQGKNIPNSANGIIGTHQILCDIYQEVETQSNSADMIGNDDKTIAFQSDYPYIFIKDTDYTNLDDFVASLGTSVINYPLATPIVHSLETVEFLGTVELPVLPNPMTAWVDDGNVQPDISMTYEVDNKIYSSNLVHAETDVSLDDIRDRINALENIDEILTNRLIATEADIDSLEVTKANIDSLEAAEARIDELEVSSATIQNLEATNARIGDLETDNLAVKRRLTAAEADIGNLEAINVNVIGRLRATEADIEELTASKATVDDLIAVNANIQELEATNATITGKLTAAEASIEDLEAENATITGTLTAAQASIEDLEATNATITGRLEANEASIGDLEAANVTITGRLEANEADIDTLTASKADITDLNAATARIGSLETDNVDVKGRLSATEADIENLEATTATIESLNAAEARIGTLETDKANVTDLTAATGRIGTLEANTADIATIRANSAKVANLTAQELEADHATIGSLDANYAQVNMANVNNAWIQNGTVKDGAISNAMINSVSANKLTAGTIDASNITVTNLNADNITTGTINGQRIGQGSLSLDKLEEDVYTEDEVNSIVDNLQNQIDGAIETWTGTEVPTLSNTPASDWTTNSIKDRHIGDIYFVVNSQSDQNGYNYRFTKIGNTYSWQLIKDSDVTQVLQRLTTAEGKIGDIEQFDTTISSYMTNTDAELSSIKTAATTLAGRVDTAEGTLATKVDTSTFSTLSQTVEGHSSSITQLTTETTTLTQAVDTLNTKTSTGSGNIVQFSDSIGFKEIVVHGKSVQNGTPTPETPVEIESIDDLTLVLCRKNLLDPSTCQSDKYYNASGTIVGGSDWYASDYIQVGANVAYVLSGNTATSASAKYCFWDASKELLDTLNATVANATFTTPNNTAYVTLSIKPSDINACQFEVGTTPTTYASYVAPTSILIPLGDHVMRSLPDGTRDTLTLAYEGPSTREGYGLFGASLVQKVYEVDLGTLDWTSTYSGNQQKWYATLPYNTFAAWQLVSKFMCSGYKVLGSQAITATFSETIIAHRANSATTVFVHDLRYITDTTSEQFKAAVDGVKWLYPLATPITHDLGTVELPLSEDLNLWASTSPTTTINATWWHAAGRDEKNAVDISNTLSGLDETTGSLTLPAPYSEVEYIETTGRQYCLVDYSPGENGAFGFDVDFSLNHAFGLNLSWSPVTEEAATKATKTGSIFGVRKGSSLTNNTIGQKQYVLTTATNYGAGGSLHTGGKTTNAKLYTDGRRQQCSLRNGIYTAPDGTITDMEQTTYDASTGGVICIAGMWGSYGSSSSKLEGTSLCHIYSIKFYDDDLLVMDLIPCIKKNENTTGLFDKIKKKFYPMPGCLYGNIIGDINYNPDFRKILLSSNIALTDERTKASRVLKVSAKDIDILQDGQQFSVQLKWASVSETLAAAGYETESAFFNGAASSNMFVCFETSDGKKWVAPVYYNGVSVLSTQYTTGNELRLTYHENSLIGTSALSRGWWAISDRDTNSNTVTDKHSTSVVAGKNGVKNYSLNLKDDEGNWTSFTTTAGTGSTKVAYTGPLQYDMVIYSSANATYAAGANTGDGTWYSYGVDIRYSTNVANNATAGLVARQPVYLVGTIANDGYFYLDTTKWWTQTEPTTEDGKTYIYLGYAYSYYQIWLAHDNPKYQFHDGKFSEIQFYIISKAQTKINEVSDTVDEHTRKIGVLETTVENKADGSDLTTISNRLNTVSDTVDGHTQSISSLNTTMATKADSSSVETVSNRVNSISDTVDGHTQSISSINSTVATKADSSTVTTLSNNVNSISETVDGHTQSISSLNTTVATKADGSALTTVSNKVNTISDTVDEHSQSISSINTTLDTKADGSALTTVSNKLNTVSDTVDGHTQSISSINETLETKVDSSTVSSLTTKVNNISDTVDGHTQTIGSVQNTQTQMQGKLNKTIVETTQLWYSKANTEAPAKPTSQITSTSTDGNAWRIVVPVYNASYPNYFYCYQWKYTDGTYGWSGVTRDIATGESQERARTAITDASSAVSTAASAQATAESASTNANQAKENASSAVSLANTANTNASSALSTANTASSNASTALSTANSAASDASNAVSTANTAKATADKNVKTSLQLWFTKANETAPNKPTARVTSTSTDGNAWRVVVPIYSVSYPCYFYCYQYELADGTYTWSDVIYDRATTENQSNSRNAVTGVSTLTTKTNTISDTVDQHSQSISSLNTTVATKADNSTVTTLSNNLSTLEQDVNTFKTTVSSTYSTKNELAEVQDDISDLQAGSKLSDTKSGNIITIDDALAAPPISVEVYGKSTQTQTTGKNLLNPSNAVYANNILIWGGDSSSNVPDGTLTISSGTYTLSVNESMSGLYVYDAEGTSLGVVYNNTKISFTIASDQAIKITVYGSGKNESYLRALYIQLESGSTATTYEPYTGGAASPRSDFPQDIDSVDELTLQLCGKNLFDYPTETWTNTGSTHYNGNIFTGGYRKIPEGVTTITASMYIDNSAATDVAQMTAWAHNRNGDVVVLGTSSSVPIGSKARVYKTFDVSGYEDFGLGGMFRPNASASQLMAEIGSTLSDYEPYVGTSVIIPLNDHVARSLPDGTRDTITLSYIRPSEREGWGVFSKTLVQNVSEVTLDGTESWTAGSGAGAGTYYTQCHAIQRATNYDGMLMCDTLECKPRFQSVKDLDAISAYSETGYAGQNWIYACATTVSSAAGMKQFFTDNPTTLQFILATPIIHDLGTVELPILPNPLTAWADGGSVQPNISIDYWLNNAADIVPHLLDLDAVSKNNIAAIESRVHTAESTIDQHSDSIALKANSSDVYTKTETNGLIATEASNRQSAIEQSAEQINLTVSQTYSTKTELSDSIKQTDSASGNIIQISGPVDNFVINGKSEQIITTGKNLFDKNTIYNINGYLNNSGEFVEISMWRVSDYINVSGLDVITISGGTENDSNTRNCWYDANKNFLSAFKATNATNVTVPSNAVYLRISLSSTYIDQIQVESGSIATSYEPFTENKASPRPDWPQEIKSINNLYMCVAGGKNLFDKEAASNKNNWLTGAYILFPIHVKPNTKYTISHNGALQRTGIYLCIGYHDYAWVNGSLGLAHATSAGVCAKVRTIMSDSTGILYLKVTPSSWDIFISEYIDTIQLELGEEATEYEPYKRVVNPTILGTALDDPFDISKNTVMTNGGLPFVYDQTENGYYTSRHQYLRSPITVPETYMRVSFWAKNRVGTQSYSILMNALGNKFPTGTSAYSEEWTYYEAAWEVPDSGYIDIVVYDQVFIRDVTFSLPSGVNIVTLDNYENRSLSENTYDILTLSYIGPSNTNDWGVYRKTLVQKVYEHNVESFSQYQTNSAGHPRVRVNVSNNAHNGAAYSLCNRFIYNSSTYNYGKPGDYYISQPYAYFILPDSIESITDANTWLADNPTVLIRTRAELVTDLGTIELPIITEEMNVWVSSNPTTDISATWYTNMGIGAFSKLNTDALSSRMTTAESSITQNAENINLKVSKDGVISSINQSAESIKIQASKVEIDGTAIFTNSDFQSQLSNQNYATTTQVATAKSEAINAAATDATNKANAAQQNAIDLIPTDISELNNDAGYQTSSDVDTTISSKGYQTSSQVENAITSKGYATTTQAQGYASTAEQNAKTYAEGQASTVNSSLEAYKTSTNSTLTALQNQVDGQIEAWYKSTDPTMSNEPASTWNTDTLKARHEGDIYYNVENGHSWRWMKSGNTYSWQQIPDSDAAAALAAAQNAQTLANSKRRIFTSTPTVPYDVGDLWVDGTNVKYANTSKTDSQTYSESDWAITATDDTLAQTALDTVGIVQDNLNATRTWYATCETAASTAVKVATITPETTAFELRVGVIVNVEFTATNSAAVANLKLNINNTGEKFIKYMYNNTRSNLPAVGYLVAGIVYQFMYDGDYWTIQNLHYNTNSTYNLGNNNYYKTIKAKSAITAERIIVGDSSGYSMVAAGMTFDLSYPILWCTAAIGLNATDYTHLYLTILERTILNSVPNLTKVLGSTVWLTGTISGNIFTVSSDIATCETPSTADGLIYIPIGSIASSSLGTKDFFFISSKELWAYVDGAFRQVDTSTVLATHRIYYRTATANSSLTAPTTWIEEATGNVYNQWTTKVPPLAANTTAGQTKYLYLYTCEQRKRLDGTTFCTKVLLDENTTVIDGGSIITNSVTANQIAAGTITANEISSGAITTDKLDANAVTAAKIDATDLHVSAANIDGTITFGQLSGVQASGDYALSSNIPQNISDLNNDTGFITSASVPTKVSDLTNDSGFQTGSQVETTITSKGYATTGYADGKASAAEQAAKSYAETQAGAVQTALNTEINQRKAQYGTSSTAAGTAAKAVTCANFELEAGNEIIVKFTTANTSAAKVQLNVNSKGAKDIWVGNAVTSASNQLLWGANAYITFKYDGTQFQVIGEPRTWYGTCTTAEATAAKAATITGCVVCKGAKVELAMTYANSAAAPTLNVSSVGAKNIYFGTGTTQPLISNGTSWLATNTATFTFDGAIWRTQGKTYIDANSIVTGYISADRIEAGSISGDKITGGTLAIGAFPSTTQADILNSNIHVPSTVAELTDSNTYATKTDAQGYADGKDSAIAAAAKRTDVSIAVTAINYTNNTATLQATLYIDGTATTSGVTYKWLKDGTVISGQTSRTLSVTSAMGLSHVYSCTVTYS